MKRTTIFDSAAFGLALTALLFASCGRSTAPVALEQPRARDASFGTTGAGGVIEAHAVVVLNHGAVESNFLARYGLSEIEATTIGDRTFHLVASGFGISAKDLVEQLEKDPDIDQVFEHQKIAAPEYGGEPMSFDDGDGIVGRNGYPDPVLAQRVNLAPAHAITKGAGARIAILDTGIDRMHPAFRKKKLVFGPNFAQLPHGSGGDDARDGIDNDGDGFVDEAWGHGTHVAGIVYMIAPAAEVIVLKVLDDEGWGTCFGLASGIWSAVQLGANVINMSVGLTESDPMIQYAIESAHARGVGLVASAGNESTTDVQYPAGYDAVCSVTAVDANDQLARFANYSPTVDVSAPGVDVISAFPTASALGAYAAGDGTSMAAPFVAATAGLVLASHPYLTGADAVSAAIFRSHPIDDLNPTIPGQIGHGRIDVGRAVHLLVVVFD